MQCTRKTIKEANNRNKKREIETLKNKWRWWGCARGAMHYQCEWCHENCSRQQKVDLSVCVCECLHDDGMSRRSYECRYRHTSTSGQRKCKKIKMACMRHVQWCMAKWWEIQIQLVLNNSETYYANELFYSGDAFCRWYRTKRIHYAMAHNIFFFFLYAFSLSLPSTHIEMYILSIHLYLELVLCFRSHKRNTKLEHVEKKLTEQHSALAIAMPIVIAKI